MNENENEEVHPADAMLNGIVDQVWASGSASDAVKVLANVAGDADTAFSNFVGNLPEDALRITLFKLLKDFHEDDEDELVMEIMEFSSRATLAYDPQALNRWRNEARDEFDKGFRL